MEHVFQILEHLILRRIKAFLSQVKHNGHFGERFGWQKVAWQWGTLQAALETTNYGKHIPIFRKIVILCPSRHVVVN